MSAVPYTFANASGQVPASELDVNFADVKAAVDTAGIVTTNAQPNITSVGTLTALSVTGAVSSANTSVTGNLNVGASSNLTIYMSGANTHIQDNTASGNITLFTNFGGTGVVEVFKIFGTGTRGVYSNGVISASGNIVSTGTITGSYLSVGTGNITVGNIVNANGNGVGNIGSSTTYFNTVFAQATSAQYADLAENYLADADYAPGTVVIFGGEQEITVTTEAADERVAGVISTNPAYLMNSGEPGLPVALRGKVPVCVIGPVTKGDSLVTSTTPGVAFSVGRDRVYGQSIFAKSLESNNSDGEKVILAVII